MNSKVIPPRRSAILAERVYAVNAGDQDALEAFLSQSIFDSTAQKVLKADVGGRVIRAYKDSFAVIACGRGEYKNDLFLIFRGTTENNNKADFLTDARIGLTASSGGCPVHIVFNHAFTSMKPEIKQFIQDSFTSIGTPIRSVHCIGHSLGGAVASLAAEWAYGNVTKDVKLYTFGQPRVGLSLFATTLTYKLGKQNIHRVFHTTDPVPMVPVFPYVHSPLPGLGHRIKSDQLVISGEAHKMKHYVDDVRGKTWSELERAAPVFNHEKAIKEWLTSNMNQNPNCPQTFEWLEKAIVWLLAKVLSRFVHVAQLAIMGIHTFLDKLAWLLAKGIELKDAAGKWIDLFIKKAMRILGMNAKRYGKKATRSFLRYILEQLSKRAYDLAQKAIRAIR